MEHTKDPRAAGVALAGVVIVGCALVVAGVAVDGQTAISADGVVESTSGGFRFPDGTVQATAAVPGSAPVEDTGQQGCWDAGGSTIPCSGTGQDGELQAGVDWPAPRFTDNGDGTVTDNLTNLVWLQHANCGGTKTWEQALSDASALANGQCGLTDGSVATDWRLSNVKELLSLLDYGETGPALPSGHPFTAVVSAHYWSSTTNVADLSKAWAVDLGFGDVTRNGNKAGTAPSWPVRGGQ